MRGGCTPDLDFPRSRDPIVFRHRVIEIYARMFGRIADITPTPVMEKVTVVD